MPGVWTAEPVDRIKGGNNFTIWSNNFPITDPKWQTQYWIFISASMTSQIENLSWNGKRDTRGENIDRGLSLCVVVCIQATSQLPKTGTRLRHNGMLINVAQVFYIWNFHAFEYDPRFLMLDWNISTRTINMMFLVFLMELNGKIHKPNICWVYGRKISILCRISFQNQFQIKRAQDLIYQ